MLVAGVQVSGHDGRTLVGLLLRIGRDADLAIAHRIERGFWRQNPTLELSPGERDHLIGVLDDQTTAGLAELRAALVHDREERRRERPQP